MAPGDLDIGTVEAALAKAVEALRVEKNAAGFWTGELSPSALATATAVSALAAAGRGRHESLIRAGAAWLEAHQNADGGWGDSPDSPSNVSTSLLGAAALTLAGTDAHRAALGRAEEYITSKAGRSVAERVEALRGVYGEDRTFAAPILTNLALAGLVPWDAVPRLPFELAVLPQCVFRFLRLHVVSYALPALIGIGVTQSEKNPPRNPLRRMCGGVTRGGALRRLDAIQPASGGFLEAVPLTSFVAMSLGSTRHGGAAAVGRCVEFIVRSARADGSWAIDSNLSLWVTTNATLALDAAGALSDDEACGVAALLVEQQCRVRHPYTGAAPGGWAWTDLPGGVPDADDTARAVLTLATIRDRTAASSDGSGGDADAAIAAGVRWLLDLQNSDGGWPTFCRGWGRLPFDRSSPDITAHALQALRAGSRSGARVRRAMQRGVEYLRRAQREDGAWTPLWFGNQNAPGHLNATAGTAFVLPALAELGERGAWSRGAAFLAGAQNADGGWGGARDVSSSVEETALAVSALMSGETAPENTRAATDGVRWLLRRFEADTWREAAPIGLYFSSLWYSERLYPMIWVLDALGRVLRKGRSG